MTGGTGNSVVFQHCARRRFVGGRGQPIRRARRPSLSWLRALPYVPRYIARTLLWTALITGCVAGTAVLAIMAQVARSDRPFGQGAVRLAFFPAIAALAHVPRVRFRPLTQATPSRLGLVRLATSLLSQASVALRLSGAGVVPGRVKGARGVASA